MGNGAHSPAEGRHWGTECPAEGRHWPALGALGARSARPKAGTGLHWGLGARSARPKAGTGLHWGHVGVPGCRPKAGAGRVEGPALRRAQCARGAVTSALCVRRAAQQYAHRIFKRRYWSEPKRHRKRHGKRHGKRHRERRRAAKERKPRERTSIYMRTVYRVCIAVTQYTKKKSRRGC